MINDVYDAGYEILILLAVSDKNYHDKERKHVNEFVDRYKDKKSPNTYKDIYSIVTLSSEEKVNRLIELAEYIKNSQYNDSNMSEMIKLILNLVISDRILKDEEESRLKIVSHIWQIDLDGYITKRLEEAKGSKKR
jgi:hypothetical protein